MNYEKISMILNWLVAEKQMCNLIERLLLTFSIKSSTVSRYFRHLCIPTTMFLLIYESTKNPNAYFTVCFAWLFATCNRKLIQDIH